MKHTAVSATISGTSEQHLLRNLAKLRREETDISDRDDLHILSYDGIENGQIRFLSFGAGINTLSLTRGYNSDRHRFLQDKHIRSGYENDGIWFLAVDGDNEFVLAPRSNGDKICGKKMPSRFVADICRHIKIGYPACDLNNAARDIYLSSSLNDTDAGDKLYIFWLEEERSGQVVRPLCAFPGMSYPDKGGDDKVYESKTMRHKNTFMEAISYAADIINKDAGPAYADDLLAGAEELYKTLLPGGSGVHGQTGNVRILEVETSLLLVMSCMGYVPGRKCYDFILLDPWDVEICIFGKRQKKMFESFYLPLSQAGSSFFRVVAETGFLLSYRSGGRTHLVVPSSGFLNDFCRRLGIRAIKGGQGHPQYAYLASRLGKGESFRLCLVPAEQVGKYPVNIATKTSSPDVKAGRSVVTVYNEVSERLKREGFVLRSWRIDKNVDITVDFTLCHDGVPVTVPDTKITTGIELQMSEGLGYAYRLCGVFYYNNRIFYCGNVTGGEKRLTYGYTAVCARKKKGNTSVIDSLLDGFFLGIDRRNREYNTSVYRYLQEQAGILHGNDRSPMTGTTPRRDYTGSVFGILNNMPVDNIRTAVSAFAARSYEAECQFYKRIGKKKILAAAQSAPENEGTMLDVFLILAGIVGEDAPINARHSAMEALGSYLAKYGFRKY